MAEQWVGRTFNQIPTRLDPGSGPITMVEAQFAPFKYAKGKWQLCGICGRAYPEAEMAQVGGGWYCVKYKHDLDKVEQLNRKPVVSLT